MFKLYFAIKVSKNKQSNINKEGFKKYLLNICHALKSNNKRGEWGEEEK